MHWAAAAVLIGAAAVWLGVRARRSANEQPRVLVGQEVRDEKLKLSFRPPVNWELKPMPQDIRRSVVSGEPLAALYFEGTRPGDFCTLIVVDSDQSLEWMALQALNNQPAQAQPVQKSRFFELNGLRAWGCEWIVQHQAVIHQLHVLVQRGSRRVAITYGAAQTSYRRQQRAISASLRSLTFW